MTPSPTRLKLAVACALVASAASTSCPTVSVASHAPRPSRICARWCDLPHSATRSAISGLLSFKAIVAAAAAAAQAAYYLARAEYAIAFGADAVALKSRQERCTLRPHKPPPNVAT